MAPLTSELSGLGDDMITEDSDTWLRGWLGICHGCVYQVTCGNRCDHSERITMVTKAIGKMTVFWVVAPCSLVEVMSQRPVDEGSKYLYKNQ
jgi:hypothetical protein